MTIQKGSKIIKWNKLLTILIMTFSISSFSQPKGKMDVLFGENHDCMGKHFISFSKINLLFQDNYDDTIKDKIYSYKRSKFLKEVDIRYLSGNISFWQLKNFNSRRITVHESCDSDEYSLSIKRGAKGDLHFRGFIQAKGSLSTWEFTIDPQSLCIKKVSMRDKVGHQVVHRLLGVSNKCKSLTVTEFKNNVKVISEVEMTKFFKRIELLLEGNAPSIHRLIPLFVIE